MINTVESGKTFEDAMQMHLESLIPNSNVLQGDYDFEVTTEDGNSFKVQVVPTSEIPEDALQGGLFVMQNDAPTVEVDGEEYTILRQW